MKTGGPRSSPIVRTIRVEQRGSEQSPPSPYRVARKAIRATDTQPLADGQCYPYRQCGLSCSPFRPSDDDYEKNLVAERSVSAGLADSISSEFTQDVLVKIMAEARARGMTPAVRRGVLSGRGKDRV